MSSRFLISKLIEAKRRKILDIDEVKSIIKNLFKREHGSVDGLIMREFEYDLVVVIPVKLSLPGIKVSLENKTVSTIDFEKRYFSRSGWYVSFSRITNAREDGKLITFYLTPSKDWKFLNKDYKDDQEPVTFEGHKPKFLYHVAPSRLEGSILKRGLLPKSRLDSELFRYSSGRVYLWTRFSRSEIERETANFVDDLERVDKDYTVFEVDVRKFKKFNLKKDLNYYSNRDVASYTVTHIPPHAISIKHRFSI